MDTVKRRQHRQRRGIAALEAAVVIPLLLLICFGVIEYGWMFTKSGEVVNAARNGARAGVRADATQQEVLDSIAAVMQQAGLEDSGYVVNLSSDPQALWAGEPLTVTVTLPYNNVTITGFPLLPVPTSVQGKVSMDKEGA